VILHFCSEADWRTAVAEGSYSADTLATEGFIHCSPADLVHLPANALARGRTDLVLLEIDESRLPEPPRYEPGDPADSDSPLFPHIYGPIPVAAVIATHPFRPSPDGRFSLPDSLSLTDTVPPTPPEAR
jgi:uncharacterized protein (DUF952 family)